MADRQEQSHSNGRQTKPSVGLRCTLQYLSSRSWTQTKIKVDDLWRIVIYTGTHVEHDISIAQMVTSENQ